VATTRRKRPTKRKAGSAKRSSPKAARAKAVTSFSATPRLKLRLKGDRMAWLLMGPLWLRANTKGSEKVLPAKLLAKAALKKFLGK
jgi:hypothetical protein